MVTEHILISIHFYQFRKKNSDVWFMCQNVVQRVDTVFQILNTTVPDSTFNKYLNIL